MSSNISGVQNEAFDIASDIWHVIGMPSEALTALSLPGSGLGLPSSFKIGPFAQATIAVSALAAATLHAHKIGGPISRVEVPLRHACAEFKSERLYQLDDRTNEDPWGPIGGLHATSDGFVRIHDAFPHHRAGALKLLGLGMNATRQDVADAVKRRKALDLEEEAINNGLVIAALRSTDEWASLEQAKCLSKYPINIRKIKSAAPYMPARISLESKKCLQGVRVLDLSRVIAAPVAGKTLAAHGADVLWVTSPDLPTLPDLDCDVQRGKRTIQLDLRSAAGKTALLNLAKDADVLLQGYRPGSLAALGISQQILHELNPNLVVANLSAYSPQGPWSSRRGFDSIVQTCSGMNVSEAQRFGDGSPARPLPCQALDHGSGYLLATGIIAALYKRAINGGSHVLDGSLAGTMKYLCSLGQWPGKSGFACDDIVKIDDAAEFMETRMTGIGKLTAMRHSATIEGVDVGWGIMPKPLGSDETRWLT